VHVLRLISTTTKPCSIKEEVGRLEMKSYEQNNNNNNKTRAEKKGGRGGGIEGCKNQTEKRRKGVTK
jgi:hypothetical protein